MLNTQSFKSTYKWEILAEKEKPLLNINTGILLDEFWYDDEFKTLETTPTHEELKKKFLT